MLFIKNKIITSENEGYGNKVEFRITELSVEMQISPIFQKSTEKLRKITNYFLKNALLLLLLFSDIFIFTINY